METFLPDTVKAVLLALLAIGFVLAWLARLFPDVRWLHVFRLPAARMSEEERARRRRAGNRQAALEIMIAGLAVPLLYFVSTVMMFNKFKPLPTMIVGACSASCMTLGVWILVRNRHR